MRNLERRLRVGPWGRAEFTWLRSQLTQAVVHLITLAIVAE